MQAAPLPHDEADRLKKVHALGLLDTKPEERFDAITREALEVFQVPISTITIMDEKREWYKSCQGLSTKEAPREISFCAHAMLSRQICIVEDTLEDLRFVDNPMVTGEPHIRFYAGVALYSKNGAQTGIFCIKDTKPRKLSAEQVMLLLEFSKRAAAELDKKL